jgi:signal transduction histidine kinase
MSLRKKLTLVFSILIGVTLLVVGGLVYSLVNVILIDQIDQRLITVSDQIIQRLTIAPNNTIYTRGLLEFAPRDGQIFQIWNNSTDLVFSRPYVLSNSLDLVGLQEGETVFRSVLINGQRYRVMSVPLSTNRGLTGVLQIGMDMGLVELTTQTLRWVLIIMLSLAVILAAIITNIVVEQNLATLIGITSTAKEITDNNDLSRRIPKQEKSSPEIDQIVDSFNETLEQLDWLLNSQKRLLADVSHELRTPLTVIKGEVGFIRKYKQIDEDSIGAIESEVDRLTRLVGNLLMLAQAESGDLPMEFSEFQLDELVCEVFQHMRTLAAERVEICLDNLDQVAVVGDRDRIKQVLLNLVGNAIQYTRDNGKVCISLLKENENATIVVSDNGPGINKEDLVNIFDRFYRGEKSRTRSKQSGFGLGLSISKFIIDQHQGEIKVTSEPGKGTVFSVNLPLKR